MMKYFFLIICCIAVFSNNIYAQNSENIKTTLTEIDELYYLNKKINALEKLTLIIDSSEYKIAIEDRISAYKWITLLAFELDFLTQSELAVRKLILIENDFSAEKIPYYTKELKLFVDKIIANENKDFVFVNKHKQDKDFVPANVTVFSKEDIKAMRARDLLDLLRITSGFAEIGDNNERNFASRGIFGTTVQDVLILINGHSINDLLSSSNAPDWLALDYIEQLEIVRGPGSALFGGNAFSAVINIITKTGKSTENNSISMWHGSGAQSKLGVLNERSLYRFNHQFGKKIGNQQELYVSSTIYSFGGSEIQHSDDELDPNIYPDVQADSILLDPKLVEKREYVNQYLPSYNFLTVYNRKSLTITANAQSSTLVFARPFSQNLWGETSGDYVNKRRYKMDKRNFIELSTNVFNNTNIFKDNLVLKLSYDHFQKDLYNPSTSDNSTILSRLSGNEHRFKSALEFSTDQWGFKNHKSHTVIGVQSAINLWYYKFNETNSIDDSLTDTGSLIDNSSENFFPLVDGKKTENNAGLYFQTEQEIIPKELLLTFGARFNYHDQYANFKETFRWGHHVSPRIALVFIPEIKFKDKNPLKLKAFYNSAFLPPPFLYRRGGIPAFAGDSNLTTQNVETIEGLIFGDIGNGFSYSFNFYRNSINNFINRVDNLYQNDSLQLRVINGFEFNLNYKFIFNNESTLKVFVNSTQLKLLKYEKDQGGSSIFKTFGNIEEEDLMWMPKFTFNSGFTFNKKISETNHLLIGLRLIHSGSSQINRQYYLSENGPNNWIFDDQRDTLAQRQLFDFNISYKSRNHEIGFVVKNLLNKTNYLPALASPSGRVMGESRIWHLTYKYLLGGKHR